MAAEDQLDLTPQLEGFVVSALLVGAAIGSVIGGRRSTQNDFDFGSYIFRRGNGLHVSTFGSCNDPL